MSASESCQIDHVSQIVLPFFWHYDDLWRSEVPDT